MGEPKALLKIGSRTFLKKIYNTLYACNFLEILLVLGKDADLIKASARDIQVKIVINEDYKLGQLSSIHTAIRQLSSASEGLFIALVDMPLVSGATMKLLVETWEQNKEKIIIPQYQGRGGHPVIFPGLFFDELLAAPIDRGARVVVYNNPDQVIRVPVNDYGVRKDFDYPEDLAELDI